MARTPWQERVWIDARRRDGEPCIKGTRIPVRTIIGNLADGMTPKEVLEAYPQLAPGLLPLIGTSKILIRRSMASSSGF